DDFFLLASQDDLLAGALAKTLTARGFACTTVPWAEAGANGRLAAGRRCVLFAPDFAGAENLGAAAVDFYRRAFVVAKQAANRCRLFATVARVDGSFGFAANTAQAASLAGAVGGGLSGLAKTAGFEWNGAVCRAFDVAPVPQSKTKSSIAADDVA